MVLTLTNSIRIKRESLRSGAQFLSQAENEIAKGSSILLFPEGTRSKTKEMRRFKEGAFFLAKKMGCGVIPIVHTGSENTFDRGSWVLKGKTSIHIRILDEIPVSEVERLNVKELMALTREKMEEGLAICVNHPSGIITWNLPASSLAIHLRIQRQKQWLFWAAGGCLMFLLIT